MKKPIAIIQTGQPVASALSKHGHFNQWFIHAMQIEECLTKTYPVYEQMILPDINDISGLIITGSPSMVTEQLDWSEQTIYWLRQLLDTDTPVLGVCYGHQMLAKLLGGTVDWNPLGRQMGQVHVKLTDDAKNDRLFMPLLSPLSSDMTVHDTLPFLATHQQAVTSLPDDVTILGSTALDKYHGFRYKNNIWGLQFHPEFTAPIIKDYITTRAGDLVKEGLNPEQMIAEIGTEDHGSTLMQSFKDLCLSC